MSIFFPLQTPIVKNRLLLLLNLNWLLILLIFDRIIRKILLIRPFKHTVFLYLVFFYKTLILFEFILVRCDFVHLNSIRYHQKTIGFKLFDMGLENMFDLVWTVKSYLNRIIFLIIIVNLIYIIQLSILAFT